jgi:hypothetical protein
MGRYVARTGRDEKCMRNFSRKTSREEPLERLRRRWEDNIRIELGEIGWEGVDWIRLTRDRDQ